MVQLVELSVDDFPLGQTKHTSSLPASSGGAADVKAVPAGHGLHMFFDAFLQKLPDGQSTSFDEASVPHLTNCPSLRGRKLRVKRRSKVLVAKTEKLLCII